MIKINITDMQTSLFSQKNASTGSLFDSVCNLSYF